MKLLINLFEISRVERISYRSDINGLRGIAVISVVMYHAELNLLKGGWLGVDIFFVISGYLISNIIVSELNKNQFSFKSFYLRRVKRILPALLSTLLFTIPFAYWLLSPVAMQDYINSLLASIFFYSNFYFQNLDFYVAEATKFMPLMHTWSLSIEEQFYIFFPLIIYIFFRYFKNHVSNFILIFLFISILLNIFTQDVIKFYQLQFRLWELLLGVVVMVISSNINLKHLDSLGLTLTLFPLFYFDDSWILDIEPKIVTLLGVSFIILSHQNNVFVSNLLSNKFLALLGLSSYSIYLLHQPIFAFVNIYSRGRLQQIQFEIALLIVLLNVLIGILSYQLIEKRYYFLPYYKYLMVLILFLIPAFSYFGKKDSGYITRFDNSTQMLEGYYSDFQRVGFDQSDCQDELKLKIICEVNYSNNKINLIIVGDSHLEVISKVLFEELDSSKYNLFVSVRQGCPFILDLPTNTSRAACGGNPITEELKSILKEGKSIIVYGGRFPWYFNGNSFETNFGTNGDDIKKGSDDLLNGLRKNVEFFTKNSEMVILINPIPELGYYPLEPYLYGYFKIDEEIAYEKILWDDYTKEINKLFESLQSQKVKIINTENIFCDSYIENKCTSSHNGIFFYYDDDHLTRDGAILVVNNLISILD